MIDVVIPTIRGREEDLVRCVKSYLANSLDGLLNVIVIRDMPTVGLAWIEGTKQGKAPYVHLSCDDLEMTSETWAGACIEVADAGMLPCPIIYKPQGGVESCGGQMSAPANLLSEIQPDRTEVEFTTVPFGTREQVEAIGMSVGHYMTDTFFSHKGRDLGWPTVVTYGYELVHHRSDVGRRNHDPADQKAYDDALRS